VPNGSFESELDGFSVTVTDPEKVGWFALNSSASAPFPLPAELKNFTLPEASDGQTAAVWDSADGQTAWLYFPYHVNGPSEMLHLSYYVNNKLADFYDGSFYTPATFYLDNATLFNQQALVYIANASADPTAYPDAANIIIITSEGSPVTTGTYLTTSWPLDDYVGQDINVVCAAAVNQWFMTFAVDNIFVTGPNCVAPVKPMKPGRGRRNKKDNASGVTFPSPTPTPSP
jgi:hypothetical protein